MKLEQPGGSGTQSSLGSDCCAFATTRLFNLGQWPRGVYFELSDLNLTASAYSSSIIQRKMGVRNSESIISLLSHYDFRPQLVATEASRDNSVSNPALT